MRKLTVGLAVFLLLLLLNGGYAHAVLVSSSPASENDKTSKLVSGNDSVVSESSAPAPAPSGEAPVPPGKIRLKFKPKTPAAVTPYSPPPSAYVGSIQKNAAAEAVKKSDISDDDMELGISKKTHPAWTKPETVNPFVQTVNGPKTLDYTKPRPAHILDPGKQKGSSGTTRITGTIRPAQSSSN